MGLPAGQQNTDHQQDDDEILLAYKYGVVLGIHSHAHPDLPVSINSRTRNDWMACWIVTRYDDDDWEASRGILINIERSSGPATPKRAEDSQNYYIQHHSSRAPTAAMLGHAAGHATCVDSRLSV